MGQKKRSDRLKILVVIPSLVMGGAERLTVYILQRLNRYKFDLALCLFENKGSLLNELPHNIKIYNLEKRNRWSFFRLIFALNKVIKNYNPDIIYTRMWYATSVVTASKWLYLNKIPLIANEEHNHKRDILPDDPFGDLKRLFMNFAHKKADLVIAPSKGVKGDISQSYNLNPRKIKVIYNSVDLELIEKSKKMEIKYPWFKENIPIIIAFGRLISRKGFLDLIKAFHLVCAQLPSLLVFIGEGEQRPCLEKLTEGLNLHGKVLFLGYQENPFKFITRSTIFVLSSHWEGFGNVIIEAMACGVPVIATHCPYGPDEIITDGVNGLLVPVGDIDAMAKAILRLLKDETLRLNLAEAGKRRAEDFRVEKMVAEYERVFEEYALE
ncbi:MAG: glycosyltransferase [Deltaproteobacteria bacterium]|nr:glycosyltransferase [Deltaproteobacteria bacterium]